MIVLLGKAGTADMVIVGLDAETQATLAAGGTVATRMPGLPAVTLIGAEDDRSVVARLVDGGLLPPDALEQYQAPGDGEATSWTPDGGTETHRIAPAEDPRHAPSVTHPQLPDGYDPDERMGDTAPDRIDAAPPAELADYLHRAWDAGYDVGVDHGALLADADARGAQAKAAALEEARSDASAARAEAIDGLAREAAGRVTLPDPRTVMMPLEDLVNVLRGFDAHDPDDAHRAAFRRVAGYLAEAGIDAGLPS